MLNCFLIDGTLHNASASGVYDDVQPDSGFGYATDYLKSYFKSPKLLADTRSTRIDLSGVLSTFKMRLMFDNEFNTETADLSAITSSDIAQLFAVVETLTYYTSTPDASLESLMVGDSATYGVYVPESLQRSTAVTETDLRANDSAAGVPKLVRHWVYFKALLDGEEVAFKVWVSNTDFLTDYPHTYFVKVIYPGIPDKLLDGSYSGIITTISEVSNYMVTTSSAPIGDHDNTGIANFTSAYYPTGMTVNAHVNIGVLYKGAIPTTQDLRIFIRDDLLGLMLAPESTWREVLPDLFIDGRFFLIPIWHHYVQLPTVKHPKGIVPMALIKPVLEAIYPNLDINWLLQYAELLVAASSEFAIIAVPDTGNAVIDRSLVNEHPTYQPIDATIYYFHNQELKTQMFSIKLANAISILAGGSNNTVFTEDVFYGRTYLSFAESGKEYHILKSNEYPSTI